MKVFLVIVSTEDGEKYKFLYKERPAKERVFDDFFEDWTEGIYDKEDWGICISHEITELELRD